MIIIDSSQAVEVLRAVRDNDLLGTPTAAAIAPT
jgi:hypothetical protein